MGRRRKAEHPTLSEDELMAGHVEFAGHDGIAQLAQEVDSALSSSGATNFMVVGALTLLLQHAVAQMYAQAFHRPELHETIASAIEKDINAMSVNVMRRATEIAMVIDADGLLPN